MVSSQQQSEKNSLPKSPQLPFRAVDLLRSTDPRGVQKPDKALLALAWRHERKKQRVTEYQQSMTEFRQMMLDFQGPDGQKFHREEYGPNEELLTWTEWQVDCARFDQLATIFNDPELPDEEFQTYIRNSGKEREISIEAVLGNSEMFHLLQDTSTLAAGKVNSPLEHILLVFEHLQTEGLSTLENVAVHPRVFLRWFVFFHDLAKVVMAKHLGHGAGAAEIARTYFVHANAIAVTKGQKEPYSPLFLDQLYYCLEHHHVFQQLSLMFKAYAVEHAEVGQPVQEIKKFLDIFSRHDQGKMEKSERLQELFEEIQQKGEKLFDMSEFQDRFPLLFHNADLFFVMTIFTAADVGSDPEYDRRFAPENDILSKAVRVQ